MRKTSLTRANRLIRLALWCALAVLGAVPARAGLTVDVHLYYQNNYYIAYSWLSANTNSPPPIGSITIASPQGLYQGTTLNYTSDGTNLTGGGGGWAINDFPSFMTWLTNGAWTLGITNGPNTNLLYTFTVTATNIPASDLEPIVFTFPFNGESNVSDLPDFVWQGPPGWEGSLSVNDNWASADLSGTETNWPSSALLPDGANTFSVTYTSNATALVVASIPVEINSHAALPDWISTATLECDGNSTFSVGTAPSFGVPALPGGHTNIAHYTFDNPDQPGNDSSPYANNIDGGSSWGPYSQFSTNAIAGAGAVQFFGTSSIADGDGMTGRTFSNLVTALSGDFTVSCWVNTTNVVGDNDSAAVNGMTVLSDYFERVDDAIPIGVTGTKAAFFTGDASGLGDTLHSTNDVVTGNYVHIAVTRNQTNGTKMIYINGVLDQSDVATTDLLLGDDNYISIGGFLGSSYTGLLDDLQIYTGMLDSDEIAYIHNHPGMTIPDKVAVPPGANMVAHYTFDASTNLGADSSGNGYDLNYNGNPQGSGVVFNTNAEAGAGAAYFDGGSFLSYTTAPPAVLSALAGDFTICLWINTTSSYDYDDDYAYNGAGIVAADVPGLANDLVPIALTGGGIGFNTGGNADDTLSSSADLNDGNYHQVIVTRVQATGEKQMYIDGQWNNSDFATTNLLDDSQLIAIGAQIDASQSDPANANPQNFYQGLIDDIQIYSSALSPSQIAYLYNNPGSTLPTNALSVPPPPVSVALELNIYRSHDPVSGDYYAAFPGFSSVSPSAITTNWVISPNGYFWGETYPGGGSSTSYEISTLDQVLNEFTNGLWTIYINKGDPSQQTFTFSVTVTGLTTSLLAPVDILVPVNGATGVSSNTPFEWTGPGDFTSLSVYTQRPDGSDIANADLDVTAANWPSPPVQGLGTNQLFITYESNNFPGIAFSTPVNASSAPVASWTPVVVNLYSTATSQFIVAPTPTLGNVARNGTNLQFSFQSQSNYNATVRYTTNLASTNWSIYTNVTVSGSVQVIQLPLSLFGSSKAGFVRVGP